MLVIEEVLLTTNPGSYSFVRKKAPHFNQNSTNLQIKIMLHALKKG